MKNCAAPFGSMAGKPPRWDRNPSARGWFSRALLGLLLGGAGLFFWSACGPPEDEAWIRIVGFQQTTEDAAVVDLTIVESDLRDETTDYVNVLLENFTTTVGTSSSTGVGIAVYLVRVDYTLRGFSLPVYEYPLSLYLAPAGGEGEATATGTLTDLPLVPSILKGWLSDPVNIPADVTDGNFQVQARITVLARTVEGRELETSGSLSVFFH